MHHFSLEPAICFQRSINLKLYHQLLVFFALPNHLLNLDHQHLIFRSCLSSVYSASMIFSLPSTPLLWQDKYFLETLDESPLHLHSLTLVNPLYSCSVPQPAMDLPLNKENHSVQVIKSHHQKPSYHNPAWYHNLASSISTAT